MKSTLKDARTIEESITKLNVSQCRLSAIFLLFFFHIHVISCFVIIYRYCLGLGYDLYHRYAAALPYLNQFLLYIRVTRNSFQRPGILRINCSPISFAMHLATWHRTEQDISGTWNWEKIEICRVKIYRQRRVRMNHCRCKLGCLETTFPTFSSDGVVLVCYNLNNLHSKTNECRARNRRPRLLKLES